MRGLEGRIGGRGAEREEVSKRFAHLTAFCQVSPGSPLRSIVPPVVDSGRIGWSLKPPYGSAIHAGPRGVVEVVDSVFFSSWMTIVLDFAYIDGTGLLYLAWRHDSYWLDHSAARKLGEVVAFVPNLDALKDSPAFLSLQSVLVNNYPTSVLTASTASTALTVAFTVASCLRHILRVILCRVLCRVLRCDLCRASSVPSSVSSTASSAVPLSVSSAVSSIVYPTMSFAVFTAILSTTSLYRVSNLVLTPINEPQ